MKKEGKRRQSGGTRSQGFLLGSVEEFMQGSSQSGKQACWRTGRVARRWERGGHPSLLWCTVISHPSQSGGLFELYVPLIIHLGFSVPGQAHKDQIYVPTGNERI